MLVVVGGGGDRDCGVVGGGGDRGCGDCGVVGVVVIWERCWLLHHISFPELNYKSPQDIFTKFGTHIKQVVNWLNFKWVYHDQ